MLCQLSSVYVVYTRWKNLKKTSGMVDGQVGFNNPQNVRRREVEKNPTIVRALNKTKEERHPNLAQEQQDRLAEIQASQKADRRAQEKQKRIQAMEEKKRAEEMSYDRIMKRENMTSNSQVRRAAADTSAAEEYEDDFF